MSAIAMFEGLVFDEEGKPASTAMIGEEAYYVLIDDDFHRHVSAEEIDKAVLRFMRGQVEGSRTEAVEAMLQMLGKDDLFTKAAVEASINNMEHAVGNQIPLEGRQMLGMLGFKIVVDFHGQVMDINMPTAPLDE